MKNIIPLLDAFNVDIMSEIKMQPSQSILVLNFLVMLYFKIQPMVVFLRKHHALNICTNS